MFQRNISPPSSGLNSKLIKKPTEAGAQAAAGFFLLGLPFDPEDGGNIYL
jgi:hypothetical protein